MKTLYVLTIEAGATEMHIRALGFATPLRGGPGGGTVELPVRTVAPGMLPCGHVREAAQALLTDWVRHDLSVPAESRPLYPYMVWASQAADEFWLTVMRPNMAFYNGAINLLDDSTILRFWRDHRCVGGGGR